MKEERVGEYLGYDPVTYRLVVRVGARISGMSPL